MRRAIRTPSLWVVGALAIAAVVCIGSAEALAQAAEQARSFVERETTLFDRAVSSLGIPVLLFLAWLLSQNRKAIRWKPVLWGIGLQIIFALVVLNPAAADFFFVVIDGAVKRLLSFSEAGADFVFQSVEPHFVDVPGEDGPTATFFVGHISPPVKTLAFWILPTIIFFSSIMTVLYHIGIMQRLVSVFAWVMARTMGTSGSESLSAAANVFVGQTEAPLLIKPFVATMTRSELNAVMVGGFATVAGGVMATYVMFLQDIPGIAGHLVTASIMSAPAALAVAKILVPESEVSKTSGSIALQIERPDANAIEALARGATEGLQLAFNVGAMLLAFVAAVALVDWAIGLIGELGLYLGLFEAGSQWADLSLSVLLGWLFSPLAWVMGVPWSEATVVGGLLGEKLVLTEFLAYQHLGQLLQSAEPVLSERSAIISSYALCGFANFASIGIQIGGIGGIAPERRTDCAQLGLLAMIGGSIAAFLTATIAGILL